MSVVRFGDDVSTYVQEDDIAALLLEDMQAEDGPYSIHVTFSRVHKVRLARDDDNQLHLSTQRIGVEILDFQQNYTAAIKKFLDNYKELFVIGTQSEPGSDGVFRWPVCWFQHGGRDEHTRLLESLKLWGKQIIRSEGLQGQWVQHYLDSISVPYEN